MLFTAPASGHGGRTCTLAERHPLLHAGPRRGCARSRRDMRCCGCGVAEVRQQVRLTTRTGLGALAAGVVGDGSRVVTCRPTTWAGQPQMPTLAPRQLRNLPPAAGLWCTLAHGMAVQKPRKIQGRLVPQIRKVDDIRRALAVLDVQHTGTTDLVAESGLRKRQIDYARAAAETLGWISGDGEITADGRVFIRTLPSSIQEADAFLKAVRSSEALQVLVPNLLAASSPTRRQVARQIRKFTLLSEDTALHRAGCLLKWREYLDSFGLIVGRQTQLSVGESSGEGPPDEELPRFDVQSQVFRELRDAIRKNPREVVVVTGAGASKLSDVPLWSELRDILCDELSDFPRAASSIDYAKQSEDIKQYKDLWLAFGALRSLMGAHYKQAISRALATPSTTPNALYDCIWSLRVRGVVTFNLDSLAENAHARVLKAAPIVATGSESAKVGRLLNQTENFVLHPHGNLDDPESWVFEKEARDRLLAVPVYRQFITSLAMTKTLVMVGFNPRDAAFEDHVIHSIRGLGETGHRIFIITSAEDAESLEQYRDWGLRVLQYRAPNRDHSAVVSIFEEIRSYTPDSDLPPSAYEGALVSPDSLPPDDELQNQSEESIRRLLTAAVACIVGQYPKSERQQTEAIRELISAYPRAVHKAWLVVPGHETLGWIFGRKVVREISRGSFGTVYEVTDPKSGESQACKILLSEVKGNTAYLLGFRRGVASMRILKDRHISGMVALREAFEVPPAIFMEFVHGLTLDAAYEDGFLSSIESRLGVVRRVAEIVAAGHGLDEVVLHRDLKPANVMLRNPVHGADEFDVVVLDFDLSWHRGFHDSSVAHNARVLGYAAPEQVVKHDLEPTEKTRNAAVDSFGMGMLVFFVVVGRHPFPGEQQSPGFRDVVVKAAVKRCPGRWRSIPPAIADLVVRCTDAEQASRPTMSQIAGRLRLLLETLSDGELAIGSDLAAREIAARAWGDDAMRNTASDGEGSAVTRPGLEASVWQGADGASLSVEIRRVKVEHDDRSTFDKYIKTKVEKAAAELRKGGLLDVRSSVGVGQGLVSATITEPNLTDSKISELARAISSATASVGAV